MSGIRTVLPPGEHVLLVDGRQLHAYWDDVVKAYYGDILAPAVHAPHEANTVNWEMGAEYLGPGEPADLEAARQRLTEANTRAEGALNTLHGIQERGPQGGYYRCSGEEYEQIRPLLPPSVTLRPDAEGVTVPAATLETQYRVLEAVHQSLTDHPPELKQVYRTTAGAKLIGWGMISFQPLEVVTPPPWQPEGAPPPAPPPVVPLMATAAELPPRRSKRWLWLLGLLLLLAALALLGWWWLGGDEEAKSLPFEPHEMPVGTEEPEWVWYPEMSRSGLLACRVQHPGQFLPSLAYSPREEPPVGAEASCWVFVGGHDAIWTWPWNQRPPGVPDPGATVGNGTTPPPVEPPLPVGVRGLCDGFRIEGVLPAGARPTPWQVKPESVYRRQFPAKGNTASGVDVHWRWPDRGERHPVAGTLGERNFVIRPQTGKYLYHLKTSPGASSYYWIGVELDRPVLPHGLTMDVIAPAQRDLPAGWTKLPKPLTLKSGPDEKHFYVFLMPAASLAAQAEKTVKIRVRNDRGEQHDFITRFVKKLNDN